MIKEMTYSELISKSRKLEDTELQTVSGRKFRVGVYLDCPFFVPLSAGQGRSDGRKAVERFLEQFNKSGSVKSGDYQGLTYNASYLIALVTWSGD